MKLELTLGSVTYNNFKEVIQILKSLKELQSVTTDPGLLQDLKETFSYYEGIKDDMLIEISNELGLQVEDSIQNSL